MKITLVGLACLLFASAVLADDQSGEEKSDCFFLDTMCKYYERVKKREAAQKKYDAEQRERWAREKASREEASMVAAEEHRKRQAELEEARAVARQMEAEERERRDREAKERFDAEQAKRKAEQDAMDAEEERRERAERKKRETAVAEAKARCGRDYKTLTVGMRIERAQECAAPLKLTGQVNRPDGVASIYTAGELWAAVMDGRIIAWGR